MRPSPEKLLIARLLRGGDLGADRTRDAGAAEPAIAERILGDTPAYDFIKQMTVAEFCSMVETSKLPNNRS